MSETYTARVYGQFICPVCDRNDEVLHAVSPLNGSHSILYCHRCESKFKHPTVQLEQAEILAGVVYEVRD